MRIITLFIFAGFLLLSCQKEVGSSNNNNNPPPPDTTALGKFVKATGITDNQTKINLDSLITRARNHGWWDLCKVIYPFAGGTQTSNMYNLKDPRDADDAFRLTFLGDTWTYTNFAANPGLTGYGDTHFNASTQLSDPNSAHLSAFSMADSAGGFDNADIGAYDTTSGKGFYLSARTNWPDTTGKPFAYISDDPFQGTGINGAGYFLITKSGTSVNFYQNSPETQSFAASTGNLPNLNLYICNQKLAGLNPYSQGFSQRPLSFATIGSGVDSATVVYMYSDILDFVSHK